MGHGLLQHIVSARHVGGHVVRLRFEDGVEGDVDLRGFLGEFTGVFAPLADPAFVARVTINEMRTITWPGDLDLDPVVLYCAVRGIPVPTYGEKPQRKPRAARGHGGRAKALFPKSEGRRKAGA